MTQPKEATDTSTTPSATLEPGAVNKIHNNSDVDTSTSAQHHTLGIQHNQSSPGDHKHDGKSSKRIGKGINVGFPVTASATYNQAQIQAIIDALRQLGLGT